MILVFFDVERSTEHLNEAGFPAVGLMRTQLNGVRQVLKDAAGPRCRIWTGERQGDGLLFATERSCAIDILDAVLKIQQLAPLKKPWFPLRFSVGIGNVDWEQEPFSDGSVFDGRDVTVLARLLPECPAGGVIINRECWKLLDEHAPQWRALFHPAKAEIKGFREPEPCWIEEPPHRTRIERRHGPSRWLGPYMLAAAFVVLSMVNATGFWMLIRSDEINAKMRSEEHAIQQCALVVGHMAPDAVKLQVWKDPTLEQLRAYCPALSPMTFQRPKPMPR